MLRGARLGRGQGLDLAGERGLAIGQLADQRGQRQQLLGEHVPAQVGAPLGALFQQPQQILEVVDGERHGDRS